MEKKPWWNSPLKYFLHGISFSILIFIFLIAWVFVSSILVLIGSIIGLAIGFIVLFIIMGSLNTFLSDVIWSIQIQTNWISLLVHGLALFVVLIIANIPLAIVNYNVEGLAATIALLFVEAFINGFVAKMVAAFWAEQGKGSREIVQLEPDISAP